MEKPIFIFGAHKSGTSLVRALFDGHKDLFVIPFEAHFFQILNRWIDYPLRRKLPRPVDREIFINNATEWLEFCNTSEDYQADNVTKGYFDVGKFSNYLESEIPKNISPENSLQLYLSVYVKAIYFSLHGSDLSEGKRVVEKSVDHAEFAVDLHQIFPSCTFIHIIRNPYANFVSIRKYKTQKKYPRLDYILGSLQNSYYNLYRNRILFEDYKVIKYEDLVRDPEQVMKELTNHANLEFTDSMLKPTSVGELWKGNSTSEKKFKGISSDRLGKWKQEINPLEIEIINRRFSHVITDFGYDKYTASKTALLPNKNESIKYYALNRMLRYGNFK